MKAIDNQVTQFNDLEELITYMNFKELFVSIKGLKVDGRIHYTSLYKKFPPRTSSTHSNSILSYFELVHTNVKTECTINKDNKPDRGIEHLEYNRNNDNPSKFKYYETIKKGCYQLNPGNPITGWFETGRLGLGFRYYVTVGGGE